MDIHYSETILRHTQVSMRSSVARCWPVTIPNPDGTSGQAAPAEAHHYQYSPPLGCFGTDNPGAEWWSLGVNS